MVVWPAGIFHRIISGEEGSISVNFSTRTDKFNLKDNFNIYNLCTTTGDYLLLEMVLMINLILLINISEELDLYLKIINLSRLI